MDRLLAAAAPPATTAARLDRAELIGALSHALDITEGQPPGHCVRCCWIGMHVADSLQLPERERWALYYTLLLKDLGCSSNAARICELYLTDDLGFKRDFKLVGDGLPQVLRFVFAHTGLRAGTAERLRGVLDILRNGPRYADELIATRCTRGADIARRLRFPDAVAEGIHALDEHWDGSGRPQRLRGEAIPLAARIALLAQVVDVFHTTGGPASALAEARRRSGRWFDPRLVAALEQAGADPAFWQALASPAIDARVRALEPAADAPPLDEDTLDDIAAAFGQVVDSKSPYTAGHSERVAVYVDGIAARLGLDAARRRWLRRGALLHDVGKLGVSNAVLDKPGRLDDGEWEQVRRHAAYTGEILGRFGPFAELARVAAAHHERPAGGGYPLGLAGDAVTLETRIITAADIFDALSAERPYRAALPVAEALRIMSGNVGSAVDPLCFDALRDLVAGGG